MSEFAIIILAGGEGRRIGGDKANKNLNGKRLIDIVYQKATKSGKIVAVQLADKIQIRDSDPYELILDDTEIKGPLGGVIGALDWAKTKGIDHIITLPCDSPFFPEDLTSRLMKASTLDKSIAIACSGGNLHPVFACWPVSVLEDLRKSALSGNLSLKWNANKMGMTQVDWPILQYDPFFNINTIKDMKSAEQIIKKHSHSM